MKVDITGIIAGVFHAVACVLLVLGHTDAGILFMGTAIYIKIEKDWIVYYKNPKP